MSEQLTRRDFLKIAGAGSVASAILTGCGPASRYVTRKPYTQMPEYTYNGRSTFYATTCRECPAGCGIVVRTMQGRALKVEGNPNHPLNQGKTCARGQASLQGLYNPDRITGPLLQTGRGSGSFSELTWEQAVAVVQQAISQNKPGEIGFLLGPAPDHLYDLILQLTQALGAPIPVRYSAFELFEARATLSKALQHLSDQSTPPASDSLPFFDLSNADVAFSFGANFLETYLSPMAYSRGFSQMRQGHPGRRGYLVQFEARLSQTAAAADEWIPIRPGGEVQLAQALGRLVAERRGGAIPPAYADIDVAQAAQACDVAEERLRHLAGVFAGAEHPLAIPGGSALGQTSGLEAAEAILALNALVGNFGKTGGVLWVPSLPVPASRPPSGNTSSIAGPHAPSTLLELNELVSRMKAGRVKVLFVHGANPLFELPAALDFSAALANVAQVISFASFPDETAQQADYIFPDHTALESWGYQQVATGSDRPVISGAQPVVAPYYNTRASADVFLAAIQAQGSSLASALPFKDEVEFIRNSLLGLVQADGFFKASEINTFWAQWQQYGGWWPTSPSLSGPSAAPVLNLALTAAAAQFDEGEFYLAAYPSPILGDGTGANKPWLQETPDPTTTVLWNSWLEINPETAAELGMADDDVVRVISPYGELEAVVYLYPAIRRDTVGIPFGQGHTAYGRYAKDRGANPARLFGLKFNGAGDLAFGATKVRLEKTGRQYPLSRSESRIGVYGKGLNK